MGFGGFVALLYLIGRTMMQGAARARAAPSGFDAVVALNAVVFVAMYTVFLYVDIAWEPRNVFLLALTMGLCTGQLDDEQPATTTTHSTSTKSMATAEVRAGSAGVTGAESINFR
jgi:hypothetical protein